MRGRASGRKQAIFLASRSKKVLIISVESIRDIFHVSLSFPLSLSLSLISSLSLSLSLLGLSPPRQLRSYLLLFPIHDFNSDRWMASISDVPKDGEREGRSSKEPLSTSHKGEREREREREREGERPRCGGMAGDCLIGFNWILFWRGRNRGAFPYKTRGKLPNRSAPTGAQEK